MKAYIANKIASGVSVILSLIVGGTCVWMLTSLLIQNYGNGEQKPDCGPSGSWKNDNGPPCGNQKHPSFEDEHGNSDFHNAVVIENEALSPRLRSRFWTEFDEMDWTFNLIVIICLSSTILASLTQLICSIVIIFSPSYRIAARSRRVVIILFAAFIAFLTCLACPLAYKRDHSDDDYTLHTISTLNSSANNFIMNFQMNELFKDLTLYYIELFANIIFLFFYMVMTCCLLRCHESYDYEIS